MTAWVQALDAPGMQRELHLYPPVGHAGQVSMQDGYPVATLHVIGRRGTFAASLLMTAPVLRQFAAYAERYAAFLDARAKGLPGPCLCTSWVRADEPCPNEARMDYAMCAECWPDGDAANDIPGGQSALTMAHNHKPKTTHTLAYESAPSDFERRNQIAPAIRITCTCGWSSRALFDDSAKAAGEAHLAEQS